MSGPPASSSTEQLFVGCTPGLEGALADECRVLGASRADPVLGGVEVEGPRGLHRRLNLHSRIATRVLLHIFDGKAPRTPAELERALSPRMLDAYRTPQGFSLEVHLQDAPVPAGAVKRLAVARLALTPKEAGVPLHLRIDATGLTLAIETTGEPLYLRGYREELSRAPMRETLAAGLLALAGHPGDQPLWDPMCGSGTFAIEGAWRALGRAPGSLRTFAFEPFPSLDRTAWEREKAAAKQAELTALPAPIRATDLNAGSVGVARRNARRAGVATLLHLERMDVLAPKVPPDLAPGLLVANLPYGKRVGEHDDLDGLYRGVAASLRKHFAGWRAGLLYPDEPRLTALLQIPSEAVMHEVENGGIRCLFAVFPIAR